jgi:hypothetical protein
MFRKGSNHNHHDDVDEGDPGGKVDCGKVKEDI